ncbi:glutamine synthetase family protein [Saccharothrix violaceirubra]|uniref:Glutamine synthetase n=1 Tax=Saccharothrix violaceirubra TaxID=413306 RepID=A0A7W7T1K6_9PSEU|nr:glutamine synthetase family protein [Saccharothrix violaceirubra]MBB4964868.1 glutamine synthetase [Saccharothrix violaceirubra]
MLTVGELRGLVDSGTVDTVLVAAVDMQGRLQGKRCAGRFFVDEVLAHPAESCDYLLAVDVEMNPVGGYALSSWDRGYGDFVMRPDLSTLRRIPWHEGTALVLCDLEREDGTPVEPSPRRVLRRQLDRLAARGLRADVGTELEFLVFDDTYEDAWDRRYRDLTPANRYNVDYSLLGTGRVEPLLRDIRNHMAGAGLRVESAKGECNPGQHEITFRYADALVTCDNHSVYKTGAKEIAARHGRSLTFMAKYNEREGNSCHVHLSLRTDDGRPAFADEGGMSAPMRHFLAGQLAALRELTYFLAPNVNSYKRFAPGSFAPTAVAWGRDNRTCALRVVGRGAALRFENRVPGGDVNPYLAVAALIAAGLHGLDRELPLEDAFVGNAYAADRATVPTTLREAASLLAGSAVAHEAFGEDVVAHYLNAARVEQAAFDATVTDWERIRGFERL